MQETTSPSPPSERPPRRPLPSFLFPLIACLTLGLAPFSPEPHVVGKLRWAAGGAEGMALVDWVDLFVHGAPWLWLVGSTITWLRKRSAAATGGRLPLLMVGLLAACSPAAPEASDTTAPEAPEKAEEQPTPEVQPAGLSEGTPDEVAVHRAKEAMKGLGKELKSKLVGTMKSEGPVAALTLCSVSAESLTQAQSEASGVRLGRSSLRLRNPKNLGPQWVTDWLTTQGERKAEGVSSSVSFSPDEDGPRVARVIAPLEVAGPCLICHGPSSTLIPPLASALAEHYPNDQAIDYVLGDLRGAVWAEVEIDAGTGSSKAN